MKRKRKLSIQLSQPNQNKESSLKKKLNSIIMMQQQEIELKNIKINSDKSPKQNKLLLKIQKQLEYLEKMN